MPDAISATSSPFVEPDTSVWSAKTMIFVQIANKNMATIIQSSKYATLSKPLSISKSISLNTDNALSFHLNLSVKR